MNPYLHVSLTVALVVSAFSMGWHVSKRFNKTNMSKEERETVMVRFMLLMLVTQVLSVAVVLL